MQHFHPPAAFSTQRAILLSAMFLPKPYISTFCFWQHRDLSHLGASRVFRTASQAPVASVNVRENGHCHVIHRARVRATRARGTRVHAPHDRETRAHATRDRGTCDRRPAPGTQHDRGHDPKDCHRNLQTNHGPMWSFYIMFALCSRIFSDIRA